MFQDLYIQNSKIQILTRPQLIVSIAKLEKKFKDIERQNLIQNSL